MKKPCMCCGNFKDEETELMDYTIGSYIYTFYALLNDDNIDERIYVCHDCREKVYEGVIKHVKMIKTLYA